MVCPNDVRQIRRDDVGETKTTAGVGSTGGLTLGNAAPLQTVAAPFKTLS